MTDSGEEHHGFRAQWPLVTLGNLGKRLKTSRRFLEFPVYEDGAKEKEKEIQTAGSFYLGLLHAAGERRENFGELDPKMPAAAQAGTLAEIMA